MKNHLNVITTVKGFGALVIAFLFHYNHFVDPLYHPLYQTEVMGWLCQYGWMAVELFFFLSGVTFASLFIDAIRNNEYPFKKYCVDRFSKLWPIHIATLIIVAGVQIIRVLLGWREFKFVTNDLYSFLLNIVMMQALNIKNGAGYNWVAWTLTVNVILYLCFYYLCKKTKNDETVMAVSFIFIIIGAYLIKTGGWFIFSSEIGRGLTTFFAGVIFAIMYSKNKLDNINLISWILYSVVIIFGYVIIKLLGADQSGSSHMLSSIYTIWFVPFLLVSITNVKWIERFICNKLFLGIGNISFSLFMIHYPVQIILVTLNDAIGLKWNYSSIGFWIAYCLISLGIAILVHECFEIKVSKKIRARLYTF